MSVEIFGKFGFYKGGNPSFLVSRTSVLPENYEQDHDDDSQAHSDDDHSDESNEETTQNPHIPGSWDELD